MDETQSLAAPPAVDVKAEAEPEPQLEAAASPTDADAGKSKKKKKKKKKSRRKSLERTQSELLEEDAQQETETPEQQDEEEEENEKEENSEPLIEDTKDAEQEEPELKEEKSPPTDENTEPSTEAKGEEAVQPIVQEKKDTMEEQDSQAAASEDELAPPELERTSSLDSIKATGTRAVGSLFSRFKVGRKKPLPSRTESAAKLELVSPSPVKTAVKRLEVPEEKSLDDLPLRTKRDFFADGEQSVRVSAEKEKYDTLEKQRKAEKEAEEAAKAARQSPPSSRRSSEQVEAQDEDVAADASEKEKGDVSDNVDMDGPTAAAAANGVEISAADSLPVSEKVPVSLEASQSAEAEPTQETTVESEVSSEEITITETGSTKVDVIDAASSMVESITEDTTQKIADATAVHETQPVSILLDLDLEPAGETIEAPLDHDEGVAPEGQDATTEVTDSVDTVQSEEAELLSVKATPPISELPTEANEPAKPERMSPVKSLASRFEGKREQSLDSLKFRTVREFFPEERSIRVGAEKQKYEAQAQQQKLKAMAEEEAKSKYKIGSGFNSAGKDGASPAPSPELKASDVNDSGVAVNRFNLSTPDAGGGRKKFSFDDGHAASDSPAKSSDGAPEALTPVKSIASRFEGKREQSLDSLKFRTVREFFPEERSVRVGSEKQKFEAQAKQDNALDNLKFRTVREFFPDEGKRSIHVGAEKAKFEALTKQQEEVAKEAAKTKLKHAALSPNASSTSVKSSEAAPNASHEDNQADAAVGLSESKDSAAVEPTEGITTTGVDGVNHALVSTANEPLESSEVSMTKVDDEADNLPLTGSDGLTADPTDTKSFISPVTDDQEGVGTDSGEADGGSIGKNGTTDESTDQLASAVEASIEQEEIETDVPSAEHVPKELDRSEPAESEDNYASIGVTTFGSGVEEDMPVSDEAVNVDVGQAAQHEDNQTSVDEDGMEHDVEKEATTSADLGIEETAQPAEKELHVEAAVIKQGIVNETPSAVDESVQQKSTRALEDAVAVQDQVDEEVPSSGNGPVELDLGKSVQPEWDQSSAASDTENNMSSADDGRADGDLGESVLNEVEHTEDGTTDVADMVEPSEETPESVEVVDEHDGNAQVESGVKHTEVVEVESTVIDTSEMLAPLDVGARRSGEVVEKVASSDGLFELSLDEPETNLQADVEVADPIANDDSRAGTEQLDLQSSEEALAIQREIAKDELSAENGLVELELEKPSVPELTEEHERETKSTSRPMLTTERSFVLEDDNTIETEDTVVVGERPMTDSEDEFGPQSLTRSRPAHELTSGVSSSDSKQKVSSSTKTSAHASKASPMLARKVSAGSVGSARSSSSKTTVPVPMKRASITAPTASYMAKQSAEAEEQQKASQQMKKKSSATKLKGTISDTGFIKPPPAAPTVPVPMKRASITAPTASYMARRAAEAEEAHRASPPPKQVSKQKTTVGPTGFKPPAAATTVPVPMKRASITAPTASWQARNVPGKSAASEPNSTAKNHASKSKGIAGPTVPVAPKRASIMAPTASYMAKKAAEQAEDVASAAPSISSRNKRYSNVKSKVMQGIQSGPMHAAPAHKTITKEEYIAAERRKSLGSTGVRSVLESFDRRASLSARVTIDGPPEPFMRSAVSRKKLNSTVPRYLDYENAPGYAERAQKQYERRKRLEEENAAKSERRQKELRVFFSERQQKALKFSAEEVRRGLEAHEFAKLAKESEIEIQKALRKEKQRERAARTHSREPSTASSVGASSSNGVTSRASKKSSKSSVSSVEDKIAAAPTALGPDTAIEVTVSVEETVVEKDILPAAEEEEAVAAVETSVEDTAAPKVQEMLEESVEVEEQTTSVSAVANELALEQVAKKIDFDEASSDSDEKDNSTV